MSPVTHAIVSKVWSLCTTLREAGLASFREMLAGLGR